MLLLRPLPSVDGSTHSQPLQSKRFPEFVMQAPMPTRRLFGR